MIVVGFYDSDFRGEIIRELNFLRALDAIRLIDALFVAKDDMGGMTRMEMSDLSTEEKMEFGAVIGGLIGFGEGGVEGAEVGEVLGALAASENVFGVSTEDLEAFVENLEPGTAAAVMLLEHVWAADLRDAILDAGGEFLAQGFLTPDVLFMVGAELEAQVEAVAAIEAAEMIKAEAALEAAEAIAAADAIEAEAVREAVAALIAAEIIEEEAMDEAAAVVAEALFVEEAAIEEAEEVVEAAEAIEDAAVIDVIRTLVAAELIEEEAIGDVVDTLVAADMIEEETAEEAAAAILAADVVEEAAEAVVEAEEIEEEA